MKTIKQNDLFNNLSVFLRTRGIELKDGPYAQRVRQGCTLLTDAVNAAQKGLHKAKTEVETKVDEMRQVIHEKTAPPAPKAPGQRRTATGKSAAAGKTSARKPSASRPPAKPRTRKAKATP